MSCFVRGSLLSSRCLERFSPCSSPILGLETGFHWHGPSRNLLSNSDLELPGTFPVLPPDWQPHMLNAAWEQFGCIALPVKALPTDSETWCNHSCHLEISAHTWSSAQQVTPVLCCIHLEAVDSLLLLRPWACSPQPAALKAPDIIHTPLHTVNVGGKSIILIL